MCCDTLKAGACSGAHREAHDRLHDSGNTYLVDETAQIISNKELAPNIYMLKLESKQIAHAVLPGQFVHIQLPNFDSHILRRPFSVCKWEGDFIWIMYQVVGVGSEYTTHLVPEQKLKAIGPVGRGWNPPANTMSALLVCGGMGVAPQTMLAKKLVQSGAKVDCLVGVTTKKRLVGTDTLGEFGANVHIATDDGTLGHHGFCTELIAEYCSDADYVSICGPEPMERASVQTLRTSMEHSAKNTTQICEVSLERRMACGIGACLSCVVKTTQGLRRACVDGPVFLANEVVW